MDKNAVYEIGRRAPRYDGLNKVKGSERYAADYYPEDFLWLGVKRSSHAHAMIKAIHTQASAQLPGVVAVLTHADIKGTNKLGIFEKDQPILAVDRVRHYGDAVALVAATDRDSLSQGLAALTVDYEPLPAVFDPEAAMQPEAPRLFPERNHRGDVGTVLLPQPV